MEDPAGRILGVAEMIEDITDRHRAQRRLALLDQAGSLSEPPSTWRRPPGNSPR
ncbi:hypothetical protein AB0N07_39340 [Streptomyces sp. NPDC051172]|uniref:hypothetical protein n=1 Tax=Streptomyces sp. NPDC051172 TaxID=3155796 RepID=UPI00341DA2FB